MPPAQSKAVTPRTLTIGDFSPGWALGTGLRVTVKPGCYEVTGETTVSGRRFLVLENVVRVAWDEVV